MKKSLFCAHCQTETEHTFTVSKDGTELIADCECGRAVKFPASVSSAELRDLFATHKNANTGQVVIDEEAKKARREKSNPADHPALKALEQV